MGLRGISGLQFEVELGYLLGRKEAVGESSVSSGWRGEDVDHEMNGREVSKRLPRLFAFTRSLIDDNCFTD